VIRVALLQGDASSLRQGAGGDLHPRELASLSPRAVPKRRDDFLRGRRVARRLVLEQQPIAPGDLAILADDDGVPWAYAGYERLAFSLSISHTKDLAAAATVDLPWRVGVDVEHPILDARMIVADYFEASEREICEGHGESELAWRASEIWALKEGGLKALGTGLRIPTSAIVVHNICDAAGWKSVTMVLGPTAPEPQRRIWGWVRRYSSAALAIAILQPDEPGNVPAPVEPRVWGAG